MKTAAHVNLPHWCVTALNGVLIGVVGAAKRGVLFMILETLLIYLYLHHLRHHLWHRPRLSALTPGQVLISLAAQAGLLELDITQRMTEAVYQSADPGASSL